MQDKKSNPEFTQIKKNQSKTAVLLPSSLTESFEIVLARVVDLMNSGAEVEVIQCEGAVKGCVANPFNIPFACRHCKSVRDRALTSLALPVRKISFNYECNKKVEESIANEKDDGDLLISVNSTVLTFYRRKKDSFKKYDPRRYLISVLCDMYLKYSRKAYTDTCQIIRESKIKKLEFFNGRIVPGYAVLKAAKDEAIEFSIIEVAGVKRELLAVNNEVIHDFEYRQKALKDFIKFGRADENVGVNFFDSRRSGKVTDTVSFTSGQKFGDIEFSDKPILSIFTSSTDEFEFLGEQWFTKSSKDPLTFVEKLNNLISHDYRIVVRMHPNQSGDYTGAAKKMEQGFRALESVELIAPKDSQSTYELIDKSAFVLCFGSSVGVEATYAKKPSILVGKAVWDFLNIAYVSETPEDVYELLKCGIQRKPQKDAIAVGSYYMIGDGKPGALSWDVENKLFSVNGKNFLNRKRLSPSYYLCRVFDRLLRLK
jgi:hypothetical protein